MRYFFRVKRKHLARVPRIQIIICILLGIVILLLLANLFFPETDMLNHMHHADISIKETNEKFSLRRTGLTARMFTISTKEGKYYFYMPYYSEEYEQFRYDIEEDLLNGRIDSASVIVTTKQTILDRIHDRYRILSLCIDGKEYLSMETSKAKMVLDYVGAWFAFLLIGTVSIAYIVLMGIGYGVLECGQKAREKTDCY